MADYDFVVLGSGPAGRRAAVQAAKFNKTVLVVEKRAAGWVGCRCIPGPFRPRLLRETVLNLSGWRERGFDGRGSIA